MLIAGCILAALAMGGLMYLAVRLTISFLKKYRTKKYTKILVGTVGDIIKKDTIEKSPMSVDDLPDEEDVIIAEYDEAEDKLVQDIKLSDDVDEKVKNILKNNGGIVIFE